MLYYLSLGSNLGEREQTLRQAIQMIEQQIGPVLRCSSFYYSAPWGFSSPNAFCNNCCAVETNLSPSDVLTTTQTIEKTLGRTKKSNNSDLQYKACLSEESSPVTCNLSPVTPPYSDRPIDIDIIRVFDGENEVRVSTPELTIPHRFWQQRDFVKVPLAEIMQK